MWFPGVSNEGVKCSFNSKEIGKIVIGVGRVLINSSNMGLVSLPTLRMVYAMNVPKKNKKL